MVKKIFHIRNILFCQKRRIFFMKTYRNFKKVNIGQSDIAALTLVGCNEKSETGLVSKLLYFGEDGEYSAYIVTDPYIEIGGHYQKIASFSHWLRIYDDDEKTYEIKAKKIIVYRSGSFGCIIKIIG